MANNAFKINAVQVQQIIQTPAPAPTAFPYLCQNVAVAGSIDKQNILTAAKCKTALP